jgi:hypothetical protein
MTPVILMLFFPNRVRVVLQSGDAAMAVGHAGRPVRRPRLSAVPRPVLGGGGAVSCASPPIRRVEGRAGSRPSLPLPGLPVGLDELGRGGRVLRGLVISPSARSPFSCPQPAVALGESVSSALSTSSTTPGSNQTSAGCRASTSAGLWSSWYGASRAGSSASDASEKPVPHFPTVRNRSASGSYAASRTAPVHPRRRPRPTNAPPTGPLTCAYAQGQGPFVVRWRPAHRRPGPSRQVSYSLLTPTRAHSRKRNSCFSEPIG